MSRRRESVLAEIGPRIASWRGDDLAGAGNAPELPSVAGRVELVKVTAIGDLGRDYVSSVRVQDAIDNDLEIRPAATCRLQGERVATTA